MLTITPTNVDRRGTERGACEEEGCICDVYEYIPSHGSTCAFCNHVPMRHVVIVDAPSQATSLLPVHLQTANIECKELPGLSQATNDGALTEQPEEEEKETIVTPREGNDARDGQLQTNASPSSSITDTVSVSSLDSPYKLRNTPERSLRRQNAFCESDRVNVKRKLELSAIEESEPGTSAKRTPSAGTTQATSLSENVYKKCIPTVWPDDIKEALASGSLSHKHRNEIIRKVVDVMEQNGLVRDQDFNVVADFMISEMTALESTVCAGNKTLISQMKACRKNKRSYAKKRSTKSGSGPDPNAVTPEDIVNMMQEEAGKPNPCSKKLKLYISQTRKMRTAGNRRMRAQLVINKYPGLHNSQLILEEFCDMEHVTEANLLARWSKALPKIVQLLSLPLNDSEELQTISVLKVLHKYFCARKDRNKKDTKGILTIFKASTSVNETIPQPKEVPRLVAIGAENLPGLSVCVYVDQVPVFSGPAIQAMLMLMASYWVFGISFRGETNGALVFLSAVLLEDGAKDLIKNLRKVIDALESIRKK